MLFGQCPWASFNMWSTTKVQTTRSSTTKPPAPKFPTNPLRTLLLRLIKQVVHACSLNNFGMNRDWVRTLRLTEDHKRQVTTGQVLSDNHINAAQTPLSHQVPELSGFQLINYYYSWNYDKLQVASNNSIQIHHTDAFHWAVSNFIQHPRSCYAQILDSMWRPQTCQMGELPDFLGSKISCDTGTWRPGTKGPRTGDLTIQNLEGFVVSIFVTYSIRLQLKHNNLCQCYKVKLTTMSCTSSLCTVKALASFPLSDFP